MVNKSGNIGRRGEHAAASVLRRAWPGVNRSDVDKQHPTKDLAHTGKWHIQVKARKTWNIKDVVNHMEKYRSNPYWAIIYMDSDRRKKDNPKGLYAILPAGQYAEIMRVYNKCEGTE